ncbi:MAG: aminotransferase class I/II-fold pyridoxal phosphate-dependent enzyme, partial [Candidatus Peribacteraceae bacterium]|nr:aminotransferase class I/II-fold pyridoxal phosphate-dependent enzyme [Candidatus Peribacteraceae bacterium]
YPDPTADLLRYNIADSYGLKRDNVFISSGIDELIEVVIRTFSEPGGTVLSFDPTFPVYKISAISQGRKYVSKKLNSDFGIDEEDACVEASEADIVFVCSPNNPTGTVLDQSVITSIIQSAKGLVVLDEAYGEFAELQGLPTGIKRVKDCQCNILITRTFSKAYAAAGIRLGFGVACKEIIEQLLKFKLLYNVNSLSQSVGIELWKLKGQMEKNVLSLLKGCKQLMNGCKKRGCTISDSVTHFFLLQLPDGYSAKEFYEYLLSDSRIVVRPFGLINGKDSLRVSTGTYKENELFLSALSSFLSSYKT